VVCRKSGIPRELTFCEVRFAEDDRAGKIANFGGVVVVGFRLMVGDVEMLRLKKRAPYVDTKD
jgi:hypothetical protein